MSMNDDGEDEYEGEAQADEFVSEVKEVGAEGEFASMSQECPPETAAQFWLSVAPYEQSPWTTHCQGLVDAGVELPAPESIDDRRPAAKLSEVIDGLARMGVFPSQTDHRGAAESLPTPQVLGGDFMMG